MVMDGLNLFASGREIAGLIGGKIDKIHQPEKDELVLHIRAGGENRRLLLSANPSNARAQLTEVKRANPLEAPAFCMLLRRRIAGGRILAVEQPKMDRVLEIVIEAQNDLGDMVPYRLVAEIMGKYSNIILVDEAGRILDAIRRVGPGMSSVRMLLPGLSYSPPPAQDKREILSASPEEISAVFEKGRVDKALSGAFFGLAPQMAGALCARVTDKLDCESLAPQERQALGESIYAFYQDLAQGKTQPALALGEYGEPVAVYPFHPNLPEIRPMETMGQALDAYYESQDVQGRMQRHGAGIHRVLLNNIERCEKKLALFQDALAGEEAMEKFRLYGELLTAGAHGLEAGAREAKVLNYYLDPPAPVAIPLDPQYTPMENAQRYYKKYQKAKAAREAAQVRREATLEELRYLEGQLDNLGKCTEDGELLELAEELRQMGYLKARTSRQKGPKLPPSRPLHFQAQDGTDIFVGKNNRQNDALTAKAAGEDIWLHTKDIPGSHVIIKSAQPSRETLYAACLLAAWFSKARGSENVPVDYTPRKYVKKPGGAKPGMVIYTTNKTAYVTPQESLIKAIRQIH